MCNFGAKIQMNWFWNYFSVGIQSWNSMLPIFWRENSNNRISNNLIFLNFHFFFQWEWSLEVKKDWEDSKWSSDVTTSTTINAAKMSSSSKPSFFLMISNRDTSSKSKTRQNERRSSKEQQNQTLTQCYAYSSFLWS